MSMRDKDCSENKEVESAKSMDGRESEKEKESLKDIKKL